MHGEQVAEMAFGSVFPSVFFASANVWMSTKARISHLVHESQLCVCAFVLNYTAQLHS